MVQNNIIGEIKISELNENQNTTYQKFLDSANAMLRGRFVALNI